MHDGAQYLDLALEMADIADAITMARFRAHDLEVTTKPDLTPVSEADQAVERAMLERLAELPDHSVMGEEYGTREGTSAYRWIVDPIDGTKNYVRGVPIWATLLGLEHAGDLVLGVVSAPALHTRWWAARGEGAFRNGHSIRVSSVRDLADAQVSFAWDSSERFHTNQIGERMLALSHQSWRTRGIGDFWQHMLVAEGAFDVAIDPIVALWDIAAIVPIIEEAGGRWSTTDGRTDERDSFVCTNGRLHDTVIEILHP
jgi:histidinol-phosphatase